VNKKTVLWVAAGLALVATAAMAGGPPQQYVTVGTIGEGEMYFFFDPRPPQLVNLPGIANFEPTGNEKMGDVASAPVTRQGPTSLGSDSAVPGRLGSAIVMPRGSGPMYSPKQQADREISRLIRKLG
jgi:hypothetical protein